MTFGKQNNSNNNNNNNNKPLTPGLSAAFNRTRKSPLTPKLANAGGHDPPRRLAAPDQPSPFKETAVPAASAGPFLRTNNTTPRLGPRLKNSKHDAGFRSPATSTTPSSVQHSRSPSYSSQISTTPATPAGHNGKGSRKGVSPVRAGVKLDPSQIVTTKPMDMLSPRIGRVSRPSSLGGESAGSASMFFHASDAKSTLSESPDVKPPIRFKPISTFVHADGQQEHEPPPEESNTTAPMPRRHGSGIPRPAAPGSPPSTSSPKLMSPRLHDSSARYSDDIRSMTGSHADDGSDVGSQEHLPFPRNWNGVQHTLVNGKQHVKSPSIESVNRRTPSRELRPSPLMLSPSVSNSSHDALPPFPPVPTSGIRRRVFSNSSNASNDMHASNIQSPTKSEGGPQPVKEVNSRIERKIVDLEISNSSLLAINRTLEREMRKHNAELRRFRRLSRSGRLSMVPPSQSSIEFSLPTTSEEKEEDGGNQSSASDNEKQSESSDDDSADDSGNSQESNSENDTRLRVGDEKKVYTDLARHQELLSGSRKMNHSLKRCLGWTEELIREALKALEYSVPANDIKLGGRVLSPDEVTDIEECSHGLLSPTTGVTATFSARKDAVTENDESTDSGI